MAFKLEFETRNDAFQADAGYECYRILGKVADKVCDGETSGKILDVNGNSVGSWSLEEEE